MARTLACGLACLLILCFSSCAIYAAQYDVNQDGTGDFMTIQEAIDAANDGDVVVVHPGTYSENIHFDGKNITLRSLDPEDEQIVASTVIDGRRRRSVVTFSGAEGETCLLSGFTIRNGESIGSGGGIRGSDPRSDPPLCTLAAITNCSITDNSASSYAGGVYGCYGRISNCKISGNSATGPYGGGGGLSWCGGSIANCTISGNSAEQWGGGLYYCDGPISNCTISDNSATGNSEEFVSGGGLDYCNGPISNCTISGNSAWDGGGLEDCNGPISNCTITGNSATSDYAEGGGLSGCSGTISNCTITGNNSGDEGGGLFYCNGPISNCTITGNSAASDGGGLCYCDGTISNCTITGNSASGSGGGLSFSWMGGTISNCTITGNSAAGDGGGVYCANAVILNCLISGNSAAGNGGGVYYDAADWTTVKVSSCTITGNSAGVYGGGLYWCDRTVTNCIVWGNEAPEGPEVYECNAAITYSCIRGWTGRGEGNISDDPLFVAGPLGDYYLSCQAAGQAADSPCIDAGSDTAESLGLAGLTTRTDQLPDTGIVDMGYHYVIALEQNPQIECSLNASEFAPGDALVGSIEAHNPGPNITVDAYVAFVLPDGAVMSLTAGGGLAIGISPWVCNVMLPSGFVFPLIEVFQMTVPDAPGIYLFAAALTQPGRFEFICEPSLFPFSIAD